VTAQRYDFERLEKQLAEFDAHSPNSPLALFEAGNILSENRQYARAADYLERAAARQPNWPAPHIELGLMEMQSGRDDRARAALTRAFELDPFNVRAKNSLTLVNELATYERVETPHFVIRHKPGVDAVMARDMVEPLEQIHRIVSTAIEHEPAQKTTIDLMPDHQWFGVRISGMPAIHTIAAATGPVIAMEAPRVGARNNGEYDWVRVIQHEYTHTITLSRTGNRIPHWFTEASAVFVENAPRDYNTCQLLLRALDTDTLFDLRQINVAFVRPEKPEDRSQAYAQGHWMYQYMVDHWGSSAPLRLMDEYAQGVREAAAMQKVLGVTQEQFMESFTAWAREDVKKWGMLPSPSIDELRLEATIKDPINREALRVAVAQYAGLGGWKLSTGSRLGHEWYELPLVEANPELVEFWSVTYPEHPDVLELYLSDQLVLTDNKATPELVPLLERYAKARPVDPMPHRLLAQLRLAADLGAQAIPHLEYLDVREQYSPAYAVELAKRYAAAGDWDKAWAKALRATRVAPYDPAHRELAASVAIKRGDFAAAERQIVALTELEPEQPRHKQRLEALRSRMKSN
jgi:Flp pilus assembly protein TadD